MSAPRMTIPTQLVLDALLHEPGTERYGAELGDLAGLPSGTIHPILARLERLGWVSSSWEDVEPAAVGRPQRRYYRLTGSGAGDAADALSRARRRTGGHRVVRPIAEPS